MSARLCLFGLMDDLSNIDEYLFFVSSAGTIYNVLFQLSSLKSKNLKICIFFNSNLILCHLYTVNITKFISIAVHKEIILFIYKGVLDPYRIKFSCRNFASMICSSSTLFCFTFCLH